MFSVCVRSFHCSTLSASSHPAPLPLPRLLPSHGPCYVSQGPQQPGPFRHHQLHLSRIRRLRRPHHRPPLSPGPSNHDLAALLANRKNDHPHTVVSPRSSAVRFPPDGCYEPVCSECVVSGGHGAELTPFGSASLSSSSSSSYRAPSSSSFRVPC